MKKLLIGVLIGFAGLNAHATAMPVDAVVVQEITNVYFAPRATRGIYRFQIKSGGVVQFMDNQGKITVVAKLSKELAEKINATVNSIQSVDLVREPGPVCSDSASTQIEATKADGSYIKIWAREGCRSQDPKEMGAANLAKFVRDLKSAMSEASAL